MSTTLTNPKVRHEHDNTIISEFLSQFTLVN
jgi:hypothetical protein